MPIIRVEMWKGKTEAQKRELAAALTEQTARILGSSPQSITVVMTDVEKSNWSIAGHLAVDTHPD